MAAAASSADDGASSLRLEWHDHGAQMTSLTRDLCGQSELTDVLLSCRGGVTFHAHKLVLAGASTHFRSMFQQLDPWRQPVIFLNDVRPSELEYLLQFIYQGEVSIPDSDLQSLLKVAKNLGIVGLHGIGGSSHAQSSSGRYASTPSSYRQAPRNASGSGQKRKLPWSKLAPAENPKRATRSSVGRPSTSKEPHPDDDFSGDQDDYPEPDAVSLHSNDPLDESIHNEEGEEGGDLGDDSASVNVKSEFIEECPPALPSVPATDNNPSPEEGDESYQVLAEDLLQNPKEEQAPFVGDTLVEVMSTTRGSHKLTLDGYQYCKEKVRKHKVVWRCVKRPCPGRLYTGMDYIENPLGTVNLKHTHPADHGKLQYQKVMASIRDLASTSDLSTSIVVDQVLATLADDVIKMLPNKAALVRVVQRTRKKAQGAESLVMTGAEAGGLEYTGHQHGVFDEDTNQEEDYWHVE